MNPRADKLQTGQFCTARDLKLDNDPIILYSETMLSYDACKGNNQTDTIAYSNCNSTAIRESQGSLFVGYLSR